MCVRVSDKIILFYWDKLGKPQGIVLLLECLEANKNSEDFHLVMV